VLGADRTWPEVAAQLIREYIYLYGAVSPKDGTCVYLIMPTSNTACFQAFLHMLARRFARHDILLVLDGAPNHRCGDLAVPNNITLCIFRPIPRNSIRRKTSGMKSAKKSSRTTPSNPWMPCAPSSGKPSSTSSAVPSSSAPSPPSPISSTHSDVEAVLE
jgi:transposase-like protein